jgi:nicotinate phosphoribosyltransferase
MRRKDEPIIQSLMDTDFYKFTMGQFVFHRYPNVPVRYHFINRTAKVRIGDAIDAGALREQLDHARTLRFTNSELHYLRGTNEYSERMFKEDYLEFLRAYQLPEYEMAVKDGVLSLDFANNWDRVKYWETIALPIVNELRSEALMRHLSCAEREAVFAVGHLRLMEKIRMLRTRPWVVIVDFGTRRRAFHLWHKHVVETVAAEIPNQLRGTSNVWLAMLLGLLPMGTNAHSQGMVLACLDRSSDEAIIESQRRLLREWWDEYGWGLSIALPDTYGSDYFFRSIMTPEQARAWKGVRQDSGDPVEFGNKLIAYYRSLGADPREKMLLFSDGLDLMQIFRLDDIFNEKIKLSYGWGTNLTNDLGPGFEPLSLVIKVAAANGVGAVKLSDNIAKATGKNEDIEHFKRIFRYNTIYSEECRY